MEIPNMSSHKCLICNKGSMSDICDKCMPLVTKLRQRREEVLDVIEEMMNDETI